MKNKEPNTRVRERKREDNRQADKSIRKTAKQRWKEKHGERERQELRERMVRESEIINLNPTMNTAISLHSHLVICSSVAAA